MRFLLDEDFVDNIDEIHIIINLDDCKTFRLCGAFEVNYAVVTSGAGNYYARETLRWTNCSNHVSIFDISERQTHLSYQSNF